MKASRTSAASELSSRNPELERIDLYQLLLDDKCKERCIFVFAGLRQLGLELLDLLGELGELGPLLGELGPENLIFELQCLDVHLMWRTIPARVRQQFLQTTVPIDPANRRLAGVYERLRERVQ